MTKTAILIVEDDGILATYLQDTVSRLGYTVLPPVSSGEEAVAVIGRHPVDLVLMDIELSGSMNGIAAAREIALRTDIPIIFLTGFSQDRLLEQAAMADPYGYLIKPVSERELAATVKMALHRQALDRQLKESQTALERSEAKYRKLFESLPIGIFRTTLDGRILDGNHEMVRIVGCDSQEDVLRSFTDMPRQLYVDPGRRDEFISLLRKRGVANNFEFLARQKSGTIIWLSVNARIKPADASGEAVIEGFAQDITERKRAEAALRESEERYRLISSMTSDMAYSCRETATEGYTIDWIVGAAERITGYTLQELTALRCWGRLVLPEDLHVFERYVAGLAPGVSGQCELRLRHKDGSIRWVECSTKCMESAEQPGVLQIYGGMVDISDRKRSEEALRLVAESGLAPGQDMFQFLVSHLAVSQARRYALLARIDDGDPAMAHTVAVWQDGDFAENFSYPLSGTPCEHVASQGICFYPSEVRKLFPCDNLLTLLGAESYWGTPLRDAAGNTIGLLALIDDRPIVDNPQSVPLLTSFANRAAAEMERRRTEEKYQALFREMLDGFAVHEVICDEGGVPVDYRFLDVNPAFERMTGLRSDELAGKSVLEIMPRTEKHWIETYGRVALTGVPASFNGYSAELGKHFEVKAFRPGRNRFACLIEDVTDRKRAEQERATLLEQLHHAQKMEDIGRLTGGVAHDFNNHLTAIIGCSQIILGKLSADSELRHFAEMVCSAGEKAATLTRSLLTFSRKQPMEMRPVDVRIIIGNIQKLLRRLIGEDIELKFQQCETPLFVNGDIGQLEQVIMNLATNARDAMPDGGTILVRTESRLLEQDFMSVYGRGEPGHYVGISFSDTGTGIRDRDRERIFEPFFTTKETGKGTGLGLSIVHGIIKQHGGHILVDSGPGKGTTFNVYLPFLAPRAAQQGPAEQTTLPTGSETILVCEDDTSVRRLIRLVLKEQGYEIIEAVDGQDGVDSFLRHRDRIRLVILDVVMPRKNGVAAYTEIMAQAPDVRFLFTSGYTPESIDRSGVFDMKVPFIQKPIFPGLLLKKVREVLDADAGCVFLGD